MCASAEQCRTRESGRPSVRSREGTREGLARELDPKDGTEEPGEETTAAEEEEEEERRYEEGKRRGRWSGGR